MHVSSSSSEGPCKVAIRHTTYLDELYRGISHGCELWPQPNRHRICCPVQERQPRQPASVFTDVVGCKRCGTANVVNSRALLRMGQKPLNDNINLTKVHPLSPGDEAGPSRWPVRQPLTGGRQHVYTHSRIRLNLAQLLNRLGLLLSMPSSAVKSGDLLG